MNAIVACRRPAPPPPEPAATPSPAAAGDLRPLAPEAIRQYREAQRLVQAGDLDEAVAAFERAVAAQPDFTEGWYNLGATCSNLAVRHAGQGSDVTAIELVKRGVTAKSRARDLMNENAWFLYDAHQRQIVRDVVGHALEDADAVLADPESLIVALRLQAHGVRHPAE